MELPEKFVSHSIWNRGGYVRTLLDAGGWLTNAAVHERMADELTSIPDLCTAGPLARSRPRL